MEGRDYFSFIEEDNVRLAKVVHDPDTRLMEDPCSIYLRCLNEDARKSKCIHTFAKVRL